MENQDQEKSPYSEEEKLSTEEKISRREWMQSAAKASLIVTGVSSVVGSETSSQAAQRQTSDKPFDLHQHVLPPVDANYSENASIDSHVDTDYKARVKIMDDNGMGQSVIMAGTLHNRKTEGIENTKKLNDLVAAYVAKHSDRFPVGVGTVEPTHGEASLRELERIARELKLRGVVWHHRNCGVAIDDAFMRPIIRKMSELKLIPFVHVSQPGEESIWKLEILAEDFPNVTFLALNGLSNYENFGQAFCIAKRTKNILFDTAPSIGLLREKGVESFVKLFGADRLFFGSDLYAMVPSYRHNVTLDIVKHSDITAEEKAKILFGNTRNLFRL